MAMTMIISRIVWYRSKDLGGMFFGKAGKFLPNCTASHPEHRKSSLAKTYNTASKFHFISNLAC
jgi:hypothetical protein